LFCDIHIFSATATTAEALHFTIQELTIVECSGLHSKCSVTCTNNDKPFAQQQCCMPSAQLINYEVQVLLSRNQEPDTVVYKLLYINIIVTLLQHTYTAMNDIIIK